jgi:hypothetical protein
VRKGKEMVTGKKGVVKAKVKEEIITTKEGEEEEGEVRDQKTLMVFLVAQLFFFTFGKNLD